MTKLPWNDEAVLLKDGPLGVRNVVMTDTLANVAKRLGKIDSLRWPSYHVTLPDRRIPPYEFRSDQLAELVQARDPD